jgi:hypothetical protein
MSDLRSKSPLVIAAAVAVFLSLAGTGLTHVETFHSTTTLRFNDWDFFFPDPKGGPGTQEDGQDFFSGTINSAEAACVSQREVAVFRVRGDRETPDKRIGVGLSDKDGKWILFKEDPGSGKYYAKLKPLDVGVGRHDHTCSKHRASRQVLDNRV